VPQDDPLLGETLGSYRVVRLIGRGGMGSVYLAIQPSIGSRVAIKVLSPEASESRELVERFFAEARAVNLIKSDGIVSVIDLSFLADGRPYIVMEYLEGSALSGIMRRFGRLPIGWTCKLAGDVLAALDAAHRAGVVHRDLKPDNVFVTSSGRVKVLDFGIAKLQAGAKKGSLATSDGTLLGTPLYMSPEQAQGQPVGTATDLYSMGVMLFEALSGRPPFEADNIFELLRSQITATPPLLRLLRPEVPVALESAVARALAKAPADRPASARELGAELAGISTNLPRESFAPPPGLVSDDTLVSLVPSAPNTGPVPPTVRAISSASLAPALAPTSTATTTTGASDATVSRSRWVVGLAVGLGGMVLLSGLAILGVFYLGMRPGRERAREPRPPVVPTALRGPPRVAPGERPDLVGAYGISSGKNPDGTSYRGEVTIVPRGMTLVETWELGENGSYSGVGLLEDEALGVGWGTKGQAGVVVYDVKGGKLSGRSALAGTALVGAEELEGPSGVHGSYEIVKGTEPDGKSYRGKVQIEKRGSVWRVVWHKQGRTTVGVGLLEGSVFAAGFGSGDGGVVLYQRSATGLSGRWAMTGDDRTGTEVLRRH